MSWDLYVQFNIVKFVTLHVAFAVNIQHVL